MEIRTNDGRSATEALRDISINLMKAVRSELNLARVELNHAAGDLKQHGTTFLVAASTALLGILPLLAFLVIGLGRLLNGNYWLSALIIGALMTGIGGAVAYRSLKRMRLDRLALPNTRQSLEEEQRLLSAKVRNISNFKSRNQEVRNSA